jgi:hypothetical protein
VSAPTAAPAEPAAGYARLRPGGGGAAVRGRAALVWVEGPDAAGFLHGLLSNDVAALAPGGACRALLLDAKGHLQAEIRVRRDADDAFWPRPWSGTTSPRTWTSWGPRASRW